jgi:hypothetical protein
MVRNSVVLKATFSGGKMGAFGKANSRKVKNVAGSRIIETVTWFLQWQRGIYHNNILIQFLPNRLLCYSDRSRSEVWGNKA